MIFPIGDDQVVGGFKPIFSYTFIAMNILVFIYQMSLGTSANDFVHTYAMIPQEIVSLQDMYTLITSIFLHGSIMHVASNMLYMWIFADNIEATIGNLHFVFFYFVGGIVASLFHVFFSMDSSIPTVGASGALSAVMGAYIVLFPKSRIKMLFIIKKFYVPALLFLGFWFIQQIFSTFQPSDPNQGGVAWWAHIGGFIFGVAYAILFLKNNTQLKQHV